MTSAKNWVLFPAVILLCLSANCGIWAWAVPGTIPLWVLCGLAANVLPVLTGSSGVSKRLCVLIHGYGCLKLFLISTAISIVIQMVLAAYYLFFHPLLWLMSVLVCVSVLALTFWNGIITVYCTSVQLGIKLRVTGIICGWIPIAHLIALWKIMKTVSAEIRFETAKEALDQSRHAAQICKTKYPIVLVHGVFFRDSKLLNYWGRIPEALIKNGADIFYGNQPSAASVADCAQALTERIQEILRQTGSEKVNIIAHSKGGLDCRYAMAFCGAAPYVASLTTINTPHRGCKFADYLLNVIPQPAQQQVAATYNKTLQKLGERDADFLAAVNDLTSARCLELDKAMPMPQDVFCRSVGSKLNRASGGKFPLHFTYHLVHYFDGANDGLVGEESFQWGSDYTFLQTEWPSGISHGDMIDLNRYNLPGFDVREFYVHLVNDLRQRGL